MCIDEDSDRQLAVKEVWIDPNFSETRQVCMHLFVFMHNYTRLWACDIERNFAGERFGELTAKPILYTVFPRLIPHPRLVPQCGTNQIQTTLKW